MAAIAVKVSHEQRQEEERGKGFLTCDGWLTGGLPSHGPQIVHVGDQLESLKQKRDRGMEAAALMAHQAAVLGKGKLLPPLHMLGVHRPAHPCLRWANLTGKYSGRGRGGHHC